MGHVDGLFGVGQGELEEGDGDDGGGVTEPEQGVSRIIRNIYLKNIST